MLSDPKETIRVIQENNFTFRKNYGQNFLIDSHVIDKVIDASEIDKDTEVLEIGPGIGTLTEYLAEAAKSVTIQGGPRWQTTEREPRHTKQ